MRYAEPRSPERFGRRGPLAPYVQRRVANKSGVEPLVGRNVIVQGRRTSMRLEPSLWQALEDIAAREGMSIGELCSRIQQRLDQHTSIRGGDLSKNKPTLTSGVRVFIFAYFRAAASTVNEFFSTPRSQERLTRSGTGAGEKQGSVDDLIGCVGYGGPSISLEDMDIAVGKAIAERWRHG